MQEIKTAIEQMMRIANYENWEHPIVDQKFVDAINGLRRLMEAPPNNGVEPTEQAGLAKQSLESAAHADGR